jgi:hypothetical protein
MENVNPRTLVHAVLLASAALLALCLWQRNSLPDAAHLDPRLFAEPAQTPIEKAPFQVKAGDITYRVTPLFEYDLFGLVVSEHDATAWFDTDHQAWGDKLNVMDLCVVWSEDARSGIYRKASYSSGQFTCYFKFDDRETAGKFDIYQVSNNHLLTEDPALASTLRGVHVGDEVHFHGYLSEYEHDHGFHFHRGTSTTRFDTGPGACETVYVTQAEVLRSHGAGWRMGVWMALAGCVGGVIAWFRLPMRALP